MTKIELAAPANERMLGARLVDGGCYFTLWAPRASRVELALVAEDKSQANIDMDLSEDGVWTVFAEGVEAEQRYGFRVHGEWEPDEGIRFNPAKLLLDPYARAITGGVDYSGPISDHTEESNYEPDETDSFEAVPLSVVVADTLAPTPIAQRKPLTETVLYETHVKGYTINHPAVPEHLRGTYAGLAYPAVIEHLQSIGVTAIELLPVHHFVSEPFIIGRGLSNFWGYNSLGFFAPHAAYCSVGTMGSQVREFKEMVSALHEAGIEVILDVVYNHTGEGGHEGPTLSYRGLDHAGYYRLTEDLNNDYDVTGCGNSVDTAQPGVLKMVLDSMRYWVTEMGVDGFRFDLATTLIRDGQHHVDQAHPFKQAVDSDPAFEGVKMIAEPWDMGPYGYQVGAWGKRWSEWNDRYRNFMRDFWRGEVSGVRELAVRLSGSADMFNHTDRGIESSVNFITAHDGFTMHDLVTFEGKHNEANGEDNRDGADDNRSRNYGVEGETEDPEITQLRHRQVRNMMATLLLSHGVPMVLAGDEFGRSQGGNNNAYCQDSPISWVRWDGIEEWSELTDLTSKLNKLRQDHPVLRPTLFLDGSHIDSDGEDLGRRNLAWFDGFDGEMDDEDWNDGNRRVLGMYVSDGTEAFVVWINGAENGVNITLPGTPWATEWNIVAHTVGEGELSTEPLDAAAEITLPDRSVVVMQAVLPGGSEIETEHTAHEPSAPAEPGSDVPAETHES